MAYTPKNPNGQTTMANSTPVVVASDQSAIPVSGTVTANIGTGSLTGITNTVIVKADTPANQTNALKVDNSAVTQPVSGTVTANAGTNLNTSALALDATLTGGTAKSITRGGSKGTTSAADVTSTNVDSNTQALDVSVKGTVGVTGTVTSNIGTTNGLALDATLTGGTQRTKITDGTNNAGIIDPATIGTNANTATAEQDGVIVGPTTKSVTYSLTAAAATSYYDAANYTSVKVQITSQYTISGGSSTVTFQTSNDGTNWFSQALTASSSTQGTATSSTTSTGLWTGNLSGRYFRLNITGTYVSGTAAGIITFSTASFTPTSFGTVNGANSGSNTGSITSAASTVTSSTLTGYNYAIVRFSGTYSGVAFSFQQSDDSQVTFVATPSYDFTYGQWITLPNSSTSATITLGTNETRIFAIPLFPSGTVVRVVASAWTSGTANVRITYTSNPNLIINSAPANSNIGTAPPVSGSYSAGRNALNALPTATSAGQLTGVMVDKYGRQVVIPTTIRDLVASQTTTISASTTETTIVTAAASTFNDLSAIWFSNTSATAVRVDVRDTTAGTIRWQVYVPAGDMRGIAFSTPYAQTTVNTNWTATCSASVTDLRVTALFVKNA